MTRASGNSLTARAVAVLGTADPAAKAAASRAVAADWQAGRIAGIGGALPPDRPARPERPLLLAPKAMPKRRAGGSRAGRIALLHALAHIELNAIDLAWDLIARFAAPDLPAAFYDDWVRVADEEARHFEMLQGRLADFGAAYGDLPAHDGLWQAAEDTAHDLAARLAVVPMVLEARGLDVTPTMIARLESHGDAASARILTVIYEEEIGHVACGRRWFEYRCRQRGRQPKPAYQALVRENFHGQLKPPFNSAARDRAGLPAAYYRPLAAAATPGRHH